MSRHPIQALSPSLVNRIAAGEVIERPANVMKELVENALDAGATSITVEAEDGGRALVRVTDDGGGIPPAELPLAFAPHATSKIRDDDDLFRIATMGFRGEALASIGAVSHARLLSRVASEEAAAEILNRGGLISDPQAAAGNVGTTVEVRNLFFNTPARRKFIRGAATEIGQLSDLLLRLSIPYPNVAFKLLHNGRTSLDLPVTTPIDRMLAAWPSEFRAEEQLRLAIDARDAEIRLRGIVGLPELARPTARYQFLYLNGRHVRDRFINHALKEAFRGLTEPGRHPAAVLMLDVPPGDVDVNVHPTKIEVRFRDGGRIHGLVLSGVRERLLQSDLTPAAVPRRYDDPPISPLPDPRDVRAKLADFFRTPPTTQPWLPAAPSPATAGEGRGEGDFERGTASALAGFPSASPPAAAQQVPQPSLSEITLALPSLGVPGEGATPRAIQLHNSYLVAGSNDGLIIIDQHALHERILFEDLLARVTRGPLEAQRMLLPEVLDVPSSQLALLEHLTPMLARLGIEISQFGPSSVGIQSFPSFLGRLDPATFVRELLERGEQDLLDLHEEELLHEVLDMMSCKAAVKAGDPLSPAEIEALLARKDLVNRNSNCPHGRPTTLRLTLKDLEKQFKRTGF